jgi:hypothetical protein
MAGKVETKNEMLRAGYKFLNKGACRSCKAPIEWWLTTNKRKIPYDPLPESDSATVTPHWATCPKADEHRAPKPSAVAAPKQAKETTQEALEILVRDLRSRTDAKVVVAILGNCSAASWQKDSSGEDLRQDLITEANSIRNHIEGSR